MGGAWHLCMGGAWVMWCGSWIKCMCILPGLVMLDSGVGGGLDGEGGEGVGGVPSV